MRRKSPPAPEPDFLTEKPEEVKRQALIAVEDPDLHAPMAKCEVCGGDANPNPEEQLCWVCRRLKISAWREVEQPVPVQE